MYFISINDLFIYLFLFTVLVLLKDINPESDQ